MGPNSIPKNLIQAQHVSTHHFLIRPDCPNPQSQSLSRSYGSNLPTSLTYIVLSTRGFSPRRPAADMGTNWCDTPVSLSWIFKVHQNYPDATITAALFVTITLSLREGLPGRSVDLCRKDNSSWEFCWHLQVFLGYPDGKRPKPITLFIRFRHQVLELKPDSLSPYNNKDICIQYFSSTVQTVIPTSRRA